MALQFLKSSNAKLKALLEAKDFNNPTVKQLIRKLKLFIYSMQNLHNEPVDIIVQARAFAEWNLFYCLSTNSEKALDLAIEKVRFFYENHFQGIPQSTHHYPIKSIHLLYLLSNHRNEQFYSKLENLKIEQIGHQLISYVFNINDAIEEGNYQRVFQLKKQCPLQFFKLFLNKIEETVRIQTAKSAQKAYSSIKISQALKIFQLENEKQLNKFIARYTEGLEEHEIKWKLENGYIYFERVNSQKIKFNSDDLIRTTLFYANELQKIA